MSSTTSTAMDRTQQWVEQQGSVTSTLTSHEKANKPNVNTCFFLISAGFLLGIGIITTVLSSLLLSTLQAEFPYKVGGIWLGSLCIVLSILSFVYLRFETNCFAIVLLIVTSVYIFISVQAVVLEAVDLYRFNNRGYISAGKERRESWLVAVPILCAFCAIIGVCHLVVLSMATCTPCKPKPLSDAWTMCRNLGQV